MANNLLGHPAVAGIVVNARDVTERRRLQESLRRSQTMATMGLLVAGVAHEVRNPLFSISANLDAFESSLAHTPGLEPVLTIMRQEVDRLATLMTELLDYGKPAPWVRVPEDPAAMVAEAVQHCARLAHRREVKVVNTVAAGLPLVPMDRERLVQVFQNLLQNAVQHAPPGSEVAVEGESRDGWVVLAVQDSGPGFNPEDLPRVFEPFFSRRRGGTGLGLAIVQRIVEEHGGTVAAGNRPAGGAALTVRLPCTVSPLAG